MSQNFATKYGYFNDDGTEYVITRPDTPKPWVNVISNGDYGLIVSQAGGGFSWRAHSNFNRLTRWQQDLVQDNWGKFLYLKDRDTGDLWSAAFQPVKNAAAIYQCRHGLGYTTLTTHCEGIQSEWTLFAPNDEPLEIWLLTLTNSSNKLRRLSLFSYLEWCLGFAPDNHREFHKAFLETQFDPKTGILFATKRLWEVVDEKGRHWNRDWPHVAFHAVSEPVVDFDGDKEIFLGNYGDWRQPAAVHEGRCQNAQGKWGDGIAALHVDVALDPHATCHIVFTLGAAADAATATALVEKYRNVQAAQQALAEVRTAWQQRLSPCHVKTPDDAFDFLTNTWLKYQAISCRLWGRAAFYQQSGAFGFRDQLQDSLVFLPLDPAQTRKQILLHAAHQFQDGSVYHWWHPLTETGLHGNVSDNLLWLPFVVAEYVKETGDLALLDEPIRFVDDPAPATLWEHCKRALQRALSWRSARGLPLIGDHDWNDGLNAVGNELRGESIWMAHFLYKVLQEFSEIARLGGRMGEFAFCTREAEKIRSATNQYGWDGRWYWRATKDNGEVVGSHICEQGKIFLNAQTWSVIAGTATNERAVQAMQSVEKMLDREYGPLLLWPAYSKAAPTIGYISRYAPGRRENGGVYTHAATWAVLAETILGRGDNAYAMYLRFNPIHRGLNPDLYHVEPYVTPGNVEGPDSPLFGRGGWTWYTGSAAWLFKVSLEGLLGIRPTLEGLVIDPCLPTTWDGFTMRRNFREASYVIEVKNPEHVSRGVKEIMIDGEKYEFTAPKPALPVFPAGSVHRIIVILGK
jgi:cellobiose phosphorylase